MSTPSEIAWFLHALDAPGGHEIARELSAAAAEADFPVKPVISRACPGQWEDLTLNQVRAWSLEHPDALVLYTHTKGAFNDWPTQKLWREVMTDRLIRAWPARLNDLAQCDMSGVWWLTPEVFPEAVTSPYYAGNFWWARASYLATLPELPKLTQETRFEAEAWVGRGSPRAKYVSTEWPTFSVPVN